MATAAEPSLEPVIQEDLAQPKPTPATLGLPAALLWAWSTVALVNAVFIAILPRNSSGGRVLHHVYDAGHCLFVGAVVASLLLGWQQLRVGKLRARLGKLALVLLTLVPSYLFVRADVIGFALSRISQEAGDAIALAVVGVFSTLPLTMFLVVRWLMRRLTRLRGVQRGLGFALGVGLQVANNLLLESDYRGLHIFAALLASSIVAAAVVELRLPKFFARPALRFAPLPVLAATSLSIALQPSNVVRQELSRLDGAVLVSPLARFGWGVSHGDANVPPELAEWFEPRDHVAPIMPSRPPLIDDGMIVLLIGVDSMRADIYAKPENKKKLPTLFDIKARSVYFDMARSPGARTITTWSSVFTGRYYTGLRWGGDGNHLNIRPDRSVRFPDILRQADVTTSTFTAYTALDTKGLARGFSDGAAVPRRDNQTFGLSTECIPQVIERLQAHGDGRLFLFTHLMDPHYPYDSVKNSGSTQDRFMAEVQQIDRSMAQLLEAIDSLGLRERTILIFVADHGEGFGQHGTRYHTVNLYEELVRVPIFISGPGIKPRRVSQPVTLVDLGPTILDLFGQATPGHFLGQSLVPFLRGEDPQLTRPIASEKRGIRAMVFGKMKAIIDSEKGREELYDLESDPKETKNLADSLDDEGKNLLALTRLFFETHALPDQR